MLPDLGWDLELIEVSGLKTVGAAGAVRGLFRLPRALWQARRLVKQFKPDAVIGVGGYASGPVVLTARLRGVPTAICEQNSIPGLTNKMLGQLVAHRVPVVRREQAVLQAEEDRDERQPGAPRSRCRSCSSAAPATAMRPSHVLVVRRLAGRGRGQRARVAGARRAREGDRRSRSCTRPARRTSTATERRYRDAGVTAECRAFIKDMAAAYQRADLIIGRAGATTVAELAIAGKPAIFIPYPFAADNHQELNAREMADDGRRADVSPGRAHRRQARRRAASAARRCQRRRRAAMGAAR